MYSIMVGSAYFVKSTPSRAFSTVLRDVLCALVHNTHSIFGVKSGEKSHVPIHNTRRIWTTDRGCTKLSILSSYYPSSPISITHRSIQHWHLINDELKRKKKIKKKKKKKKKEKNRLLGIRQGAVFFQYLFMVL